jgi:hypothetical protein
MLYHQQSHLFDVTTIANVLFQFQYEKIGKLIKESSIFKNIFKISITKFFFAITESWAFFIFTVEISSIAFVIFQVFFIDAIFLLISLAHAIN